MPLKIPLEEICRDDACNIVGIHTHRHPGDGVGYRAPHPSKPKILNEESEWTWCEPCGGSGTNKQERCCVCGGAGQLPPNRLWIKMVESKK